MKEFIPSTALCKICKYRLTDYCTGCLENKLRRFEPRRVPFYLLRIFTMQEYDALPNGAKGKLLAFYLIKVMEVLHGTDLDYSGSCTLFEDVEK